MAKEQKEEKTTVSVTQDVHRRFKILCANYGLQMADATELAVALLEKELKKNPPKK